MESPHRQPLNILVVDDFHVNRHIISRFLTELNCVSTQACNGREAVQLVETQSFDLILMDIRMPIMDGLRATRKIRQTCPSIPVIAVTGDDSILESHKALAVGCRACLTKPIEVRTLEKIIHQICN